jgi:hypothetical protein
MANYTKATDFAAKDALTTGDPAKIVKGTEIDSEFNAIATAINSKANTASPALTGVPTAPTASAGTNTTQLATTAFVLSNGVPSGAILMWSGTIATVPSGWYLCDGTNGTPNLTNRFIIGADADDGGVAKTSVTGSATLSGGSKDAIVVEHNHTATSSVTDPGHKHKTHAAGAGFNGGGYSQASPSLTVDTSTVTTGITVATTIANAGSSGTNANLPPYYALAFIMKA